jgi:5'-3' exonuclease
MVKVWRSSGDISGTLLAMSLHAHTFALLTCLFLSANKELSFTNWSNDMVRMMNLQLERGLSYAQFIYMCVLAGCDYLPKIPQVGIKTAHTIVQRYRTPSKVCDGC